MTENERHWLAGLLEGEGSFWIHRIKVNGRNYLYPCIKLGMTDVDVVKRAADLLGVRCITEYTPRQRRTKRKPMFQVMRRGQNAVRLMRELYPLLGKRRRARIDEVLQECDPTGTRYAA